MKRWGVPQRLILGLVPINVRRHGLEDPLLVEKVLGKVFSPVPPVSLGPWVRLMSQIQGKRDPFPHKLGGTQAQPEDQNVNFEGFLPPNPHPCWGSQRTPSVMALCYLF